MKKWIPLLIVVAVVIIIVMVNVGKSTDNAADRHAENKAIKFNTHIYIENSGSMDGYVNGNTEFKDAIDHVLVMLNSTYGTPEISFVNSQILPTGLSKDISQFSQQLTPASLHVGDTGSSNINNIFNMILNNTDENTVSVLVSDCVYSIHGNDAGGLLAHEKNLTQGAFMAAIKKKKNDLATIVLQCSSKFDGYYYDMNDKPIAYQGHRPFYMIFVGKTAYIKNLYAKIELDNEHMNNLLNSYMISSQEVDYGIDSVSIITDEFTDNINRIKPNKNSLGISTMELEGNGKFTMAVGFDASAIFVDKSYLTDKNNYSVDPKNVKIKAIGQVDRNSAAYGDCSSFALPYYIQFECAGQPSEITLSLDYKMPKWVYDSSTDNDSGCVPKENVTFGISYMIEGISEAYRVRNSSQSIFKIKFNIENYK